MNLLRKCVSQIEVYLVVTMPPCQLIKLQYDGTFPVCKHNCGRFVIKVFLDFDRLLLIFRHVSANLQVREADPVLSKNPSER